MAIRFIVTLHIFVLFFSQNNIFAQDTLYWHPAYKLKWDDFRGKPNGQSHNGAASYPGIKYTVSANDNSFSTRVLCFFTKTKSWVRVPSDTLLMHEQGHFDIAELYARKLRQSFAAYQFNAHTIAKDMDSLFITNKKERTRMDTLYDQETDFSRNMEQQLIWNKKIETELDSLKKYASSEHS